LVDKVVERGSASLDMPEGMLGVVRVLLVAVVAATLMWPVAAAVEPAETVAGVLAGLRL
jgi:hypothetical protein